MSELAAQVVSGAALVGAGAIGVAAYSFFYPRAQLFFPVITHGDHAGPGRIALTFDDGPGSRGTGPILDILAEWGVPGAFFCIGANVARHPDLVRRMDAEGHLVANHTYEHRHYGALRTSSYWRDQLRRTDQIIIDTIGKRPALFRPALGFKWGTMTRPLRQSGHTTVTWSRRAYDGKPTTTADKILERMVAPCRAGEILVLHDGEDPGSPRDPAPTIAALEPMVKGIRDRGIEFVRLDELIGVEPYFPALTERVGSVGVAASRA